MKITNDFPWLLSNFLLNELPIIRNQSNNTISSYRDAYIQLLDYMTTVKTIKLNNIKVNDLSVETITEFLNWLETEKSNCINTRNQRLAAIHSLFKYIQKQTPEYMFLCQQVIGIPFKKTEKKLVNYLDEDTTKRLLASPDTTNKKGRKDQALLTLLYDSGARVQELADLKVCDLRIDIPAQVKLTGKGRKTRSVPLMDKTVILMKQYLEEQKLNDSRSSEHPLFFNSQGNKLTRQGITYILKKYAHKCGITEISPHQLRHTKAMHLTEANINPIFIRDFLGHTDLQVTAIYSKTSVKMKRDALEKMNNRKNILPDKNEEDWTENTDLMDWLRSFKK